MCPGKCPRHPARLVPFREGPSKAAAHSAASSLPVDLPHPSLGWRRAAPLRCSPRGSSVRTHRVLWTPPVLAWLSTWVKALGRSMPAAPDPGLLNPDLGVASCEPPPAPGSAAALPRSTLGVVVSWPRFPVLLQPRPAAGSTGHCSSPSPREAFWEQ